MKDTGVQDLSPESCNKPSGDIFVFRYLFCRKKAWYTEQNNLEFVEENPMEEKTYCTRCGTIHYWASVSNPDAITLVFLPGLTADHRLFDKQIQYFENRYPQIPELPDSLLVQTSNPETQLSTTPVAMI